MPTTKAANERLEQAELYPLVRIEAVKGLVLKRNFSSAEVDWNNPRIV